MSIVSVIDPLERNVRDVTGVLTDLLKDAKEGKFTAIAIAATRRGSGYTIAHTMEDSLKLVGAVNLLKNDLEQKMNDSK